MDSTSSQEILANVEKSSFLDQKGRLRRRATEEGVDVFTKLWLFGKCEDLFQLFEIFRFWERFFEVTKSARVELLRPRIKAIALLTFRIKFYIYVYKLTFIENSNGSRLKEQSHFGYSWISRFLD